MPEEYKKLVKIFHESGRRVDTLPGRKPPVFKADDVYPPSINWIIDGESDSLR